MNSTTHSNRTLLAIILASSFVFHAIVLTLFVLFGFLHLSLPVEDTKITMIRIAPQGGAPGNSKTTATKTPTSPAPKPVPSEAIQKPTPLPTPPQAPLEVKKPPVPTPAPVPTKKNTPTAKPNPESTGPRVAATETQKKADKKQNPQTNPATSPAPTPPTANDRQISEALNQVRQDLQTREAASPGSSSNNSTGGNPQGDTGAHGGNVIASDPVLVQYQSQVRNKIIREWIRANTGNETEVLRTRVSVRIDASGKVISTSFVKKSGNASFDLSALRAVERASPLPTPPDFIKAEALGEGFVVDFNSRMLGN